MADGFTDALQQYLNGAEWQRSVEMFVEANCLAFRGVSEFDHSHHDTWKSFRDIVEQILDMALGEVGGSLETLEKALDEFSGQTVRGPRDEAIKDIVGQLLTYDDFEVFSHMMKRAAANLYSDHGGGPGAGHARSPGRGVDRHYDTLLNMGFSERQIDAVMVAADPDDGLEALVIKLTMLPEDAEAAGHAVMASPAPLHNPRSGSDFKGSSSSDYDYRASPSSTPTAKARGMDSYSYSSPRQAVAEAKDLDNSLQGGERSTDFMPHLTDFAAQLHGRLGIIATASELNVKFTVAASVIDSLSRPEGESGLMAAPANMGEGTELEWASGMIALLEEVMQCFRQGEPYHRVNARPDAIGSFLSWNEAQQGEHGLLGWFQKLDEFRVRLEEDMSTSTLLSQDDMQRMAVLEGIAAMGTEGEQRLHGLITRHDQVQVDINKLHVRCGGMVAAGTIHRNNLEGLYLLLKDKVNSGAPMESFVEELHEEVYGIMEDAAQGSTVVKTLLDMHILEDEQSVLKSEINSLLGGSPSAGGVKGDGSPFGDAGQAAADSAQLFRDGLGAAEADGKDIAGDLAGEAAQAGQRAGAGAKVGGVDSSDVDSLVLDELKAGHKDKLGKLKAGLKHEREKRLQMLEERLMRRRRAREKTDGEDPDEAAALLAAEKEMEDEMVRVTRHFDTLQNGLVAGFKKRCVYEMRATKEKGGRLSSEDMDAVSRDAADAIKKRYEKDQLSLLQTLEAERARQRTRLKKTLAKRKQGCKRGSREAAAVDEQLRLELAELDRGFDTQEEGAVAEPQERTLLALSAVFLDDHALAAGKGPGGMKDGGDDDDDDDGYLNDDDGGTKNELSQWIGGVEGLASTYSKAGHSLQARFRQAQRTARVEEGAEYGADEEEDEGMSHVTTHMMRVIADAYSEQASAAGPGAGPGPGQKKFPLGREGSGVDLELIKATILNEFERSRDSYEAALDRAKLSSRARLEKRRDRGWEANDETWDEDPLDAEKHVGGPVTHTQAAFEGIIDDFLANPLEAAAPVRSKDASNTRQIQVKDGGVGQMYETGADKWGDDGGIGMSTLGGVRVTKADASVNWASTARGGRDKTEAHERQAAHDSAQTELMEGLRSSMQAKRKGLSDRLKRRQAAVASGDEAAAKEAAAADGEEEQQLARLDSSFEAIRRMVQSYDAPTLTSLKPTDLTTAMDELAAGRDASLVLPASQSMDMQDVQRDVARQQMASKVQKISSNFNEENQKLDLMMKVKQARQRQTLQRKLLERAGARNSGRNSANLLAPIGGSATLAPIPFGGVRATTQVPVRGLGEIKAWASCKRMPSEEEEEEEEDGGKC